MKGTTKWVNFSRGFAFLVGDDGLQYFAHRKDFCDPKQFDLLREGRELQWDGVIAPKGPRAMNTRVTE